MSNQPMANHDGLCVSWLTRRLSYRVSAKSDVDCFHIWTAATPKMAFSLGGSSTRTDVQETFCATFTGAGSGVIMGVPHSH